MEKNKKRNNMYDPVYVADRDDISIDEAIIKIDLYKKNKATSLAGFIMRHGEMHGREKFEQFKQTSKHTKQKYLEKYGEQLGSEKWEEYISTKDSTSFNWALKKTKGDFDSAQKLYLDRLAKLSIQFDLNYFIQKFGHEKAEEEMIKFKKTKDTSSYEWALKQAEGDYKLADEIYYNRCETKKVMLGSASKESLELFEPLKEWLIQIGIKEEDIFYGIKGSKEICLYDKIKKSRYYYDFCIESMKLIFEYNGETFHPNYEKYGMEWLNENWQHPFNNQISVKDFIDKDKVKIKNALDFGYEIHVIWSSDSNKIEKVKKIIKNKIKNENKKNYNL